MPDPLVLYSANTWLAYMILSAFIMAYIMFGVPRILTGAKYPHD